MAKYLLRALKSESELSPSFPLNSSSSLSLLLMAAISLSQASGEAVKAERSQVSLIFCSFLSIISLFPFLIIPSLPWQPFPYGNICLSLPFQGLQLIFLLHLRRIQGHSQSLLPPSWAPGISSPSLP